MTISSMMNSAVSGMQSEQSRLMDAATNIAAPGPGTATETDAEISLANELLTLKQAETGFKANALVFETGAELWDVLMSITRDEPD
ncbi:flagellar basal-body rod protein FlgC [Hoeflea halophila]|uniref:Flagellar basal-body rod protein FlgC n=1 Tax=Hoeflea halophila TaxID=714899 RepID=A0A286IBT6_9HYPH|nr:flagellar basal body rod protein [Hoeflea halophila]SOE16829.1 flagellar basal-body rod protein FlgC [Hoeflea halophila]